MKKNKISKNWVNKQRRDTYVKQSKVDGYRARSAYKLIEIDEKYKIFKGGISVVDIGAAPGSWSQYVAKVVKSGRLISIDLKEMEPIGNTIQIQGDFTEEKTQETLVEPYLPNHKIGIVHFAGKNNDEIRNNKNYISKIKTVDGDIIDKKLRFNN